MDCDEGGPPRWTLGVSSRSELEEARVHVARWIGSESTSARRLLCSTRHGELVDGDRGCRRTPTACAAWRSAACRRRVRAVIESMNGARFVHDTLEEHGWEVLIADAQKVKGLAPLACKTDKIDARVLAELSWRDLVPAIWLPDPSIRRERELARFRLHLVRHRTTLKNRIHATLIAFGHPCPVSDLFGHAGRELLDRLAIPDPWRRNVDVSLRADRRPRAADRAADRRAQAPGRRSPLHPAAGHRPGVRLDQRVHRRLGDRRHRAASRRRAAT